MGVIIGVVIGYALGSRAGPEAWAEFEDAWHTIYTSEEVRDLAAGALSIARRPGGEEGRGHRRDPGWRRAALPPAAGGLAAHEVRRRVQGPDDGKGAGGADHRAGR